jgi:hypothetical protein
VANLFAELRNPVTPTIPANDQYRIFEVLASNHFSFHGKASSFVSVVTVSNVFRQTNKLTSVSLFFNC